MKRNQAITILLVLSLIIPQTGAFGDEKDTLAPKDAFLEGYFNEFQELSSQAESIKIAKKIADKLVNGEQLTNIIWGELDECRRKDILVLNPRIFFWIQKILCKNPKVEFTERYNLERRLLIEVLLGACPESFKKQFEEFSPNCAISGQFSDLIAADKFIFASGLYKNPAILKLIKESVDQAENIYNASYEGIESNSFIYVYSSIKAIARIMDLFGIEEDFADPEKICARIFFTLMEGPESNNLTVVLKILREILGEYKDIEDIDTALLRKAIIGALQKIPKADIHHHLDGSISPELAERVFQMYPELMGFFEGKLDEPLTAEKIRSYVEFNYDGKGEIDWKNLWSKFNIAYHFLNSNPDVVRFVAREGSLEDFYKDGVTLLEQKMLIVNPGSKLDPEKVISAAINGLKEAEDATGGKLRTGIILCIWKDLPNILGSKYEEVKKKALAEKRSLDKAVLDEARKEALRQVKLLVNIKKKWEKEKPELVPYLLGIDTVGDEKDYNSFVTQPALRYAAKNGFKIIEHLGENWHPHKIKDALLRIKWGIKSGILSRIGHATALGIPPEKLQGFYTKEEILEIISLQNEIKQLVRDHKIHIETNPTSNRLLVPEKNLNLISSYSDHPIAGFYYELGNVSVNTDDKCILCRDGLSGEFADIWLGNPSLTIKDIKKIIGNGFQASLIDTEHQSRGDKDEIAEVFSALDLILMRYSNVHRGAGQHSVVSTQLYERSREIVAGYLGVNLKEYTIIFGSNLENIIANFIDGADYKVVPPEISSLFGVTAVGVKKEHIKQGTPYEPGGGTVELVLEDDVIWADVPFKFEAGTPNIIGVIGLAKALSLGWKTPPKPTPVNPNKLVEDIFYKEDPREKSLESLSEDLIGKDIEVPYKKGEISYVNFDNGASTPTFGLVYDAYKKAFGQPPIAKQVLVEESRRICRDFFNAPSSEYKVVFTRNTTDRINQVAHSIDLGENAVVLNTLLEHNSNELPWRFIPGVTQERLNVDENGFFNMDELENILSSYNEKKEHGKKRIRLVSVSGASNVLGSVNDIKKVAEIGHKYRAKILVDGAQLVAHRSLDMQETGIDFLVFSGHKIYAPFGASGLIARKGSLPGDIKDIDNTPGIVALARVLLMLKRVGMEKIVLHEMELTRYILEKLNEIRGIKIYGSTNPQHLNNRLGVISFNINDLPHALVAAVLAEEGGIGVRSGSFCAHLLLRKMLGITDDVISGITNELRNGNKPELPGEVRVSFGLYNTKKEIDRFINILQKLATWEYDLTEYEYNKETGLYSTTEFKAQLEGFIQNIENQLFGNSALKNFIPPKKINGEKWFGGESNEISEVVIGDAHKVKIIDDIDVVFHSLVHPDDTPEDIVFNINAEKDRFKNALHDLKEKIKGQKTYRNLVKLLITNVNHRIKKVKMNSAYVFTQVVEEMIKEFEESDKKGNKLKAQFLREHRTNILDHLMHKDSLEFKGDTPVEVEDRIKKEIRHFNYVVYRLIKNIIKKQRLEEREEVRSRMNFYILKLEELKTKIGGGIYQGNEIAGRIGDEKKTAALLLYGEHKIAEKRMNAMAPSEFRDRVKELLFIQMELMVYLKEKTHLRHEEDKDREIERFMRILREVKDNFHTHGGIFNRLFSELEKDVPIHIRKENFPAGRAIFKVIEDKFSFHPEEEIEAMYEILDLFIEEIENISPESSNIHNKDVILVFKGLPDPIKLKDLLLKYEGKIKVVVSEEGTIESHFSIETAQWGLTAISGVKNNTRESLFDLVKAGDVMIVDGDTGKVIADPSLATLSYFEKKALEEDIFNNYCRGEAHKPVKTRDGLDINILANADTAEQIQKMEEYNGDGVGLVRTEYLYNRNTLPTEQELVNTFITLGKSSKHKVTVRLFDRQRDKEMPCMSESSTWGFRFYFDDPMGQKAVKTELRAAIMASCDYPNIRIMFPQITTTEDVDMAVALVKTIKEELISEDKITKEKADKIKIGFMVETIAAVDNIDYLLENSDFVSLGTNDLTRSIFNLSRDNPMAMKYIKKLQPVLLIKIAQVVAAVSRFNGEGKPKEVSICGDLARRLPFIPFLVALNRYYEINFIPSIGPEYIPIVKEIIRHLDASECINLFMPVLEGRIKDAKNIHNEASWLVHKIKRDIKENECRDKIERAILLYNMNELAGSLLKTICASELEEGDEKFIRIITSLINEYEIANGVKRVLLWIIISGLGKEMKDLVVVDSGQISPQIYPLIEKIPNLVIWGDALCGVKKDKTVSNIDELRRFAQSKGIERTVLMLRNEIMEANFGKLKFGKECLVEGIGRCYFVPGIKDKEIGVMQLLCLAHEILACDLKSEDLSSIKDRKEWQPHKLKQELISAKEEIEEIIRSS